MTIGPERLSWLLKQLDSADHDVRADAAEAVDQWLDQIADDEGEAIGEALVRLAASEGDRDTLESLTHALDALAQYDLLPLHTLQTAARLPIPADPSVIEYLTYLRARAQGAEVSENRPSGDPT